VGAGSGPGSKVADNHGSLCVLTRDAGTLVKVSQALGAPGEKLGATACVGGVGNVRMRSTEQQDGNLMLIWQHHGQAGQSDSRV
jgi:hypothetical protein